MEDMIVSSLGYTKTQLTVAFDKLTEGMDNWKMPISSTIHISDWNVMCEACAFFTGSELYQTYDNGDGTMNVEAEGYYNAIGP